MSETAQTLIKSALRVIGALATGETPTNDELNDGLQAMQFMFRHWSAKNIRLYYITKTTHTLGSSTYYTIGSGGDMDETRPVSIRGGYVTDSNSFDHVLTIIDERRYNSLSLKSLTGTPEYLWYSPEYPLGKIYLWPIGGGTLNLDCLKPLSEPTLITSSISFPPEYDEAIKYNLAIRLAPEYGKAVSQEVKELAISNMRDIEDRNFAEQIVATKPELLNLAVGRYHIDEG